MEQNQNENYLAILHPELMSREELLKELKQVIFYLCNMNIFAMAPNLVWNRVFFHYRSTHNNGHWYIVFPANI